MVTYTTYKATFTLDNRNPKTQQYCPVDLGEGFHTKIRNKEVLEKYDLLGKGVLAFVNKICHLVDNTKDELPTEDWEALELALRILMVSNDSGELYYYLLHAHGADALSYDTWVHFAEDMDWRICVRTFADMPTEVLEEYGAKRWEKRSKTAGEEGKKHILRAISQRTDIYGIHSLPSEMVDSILFAK